MATGTVTTRNRVPSVVFIHRRVAAAGRPGPIRVTVGTVFIRLDLNRVT
jgi:hypothetical protein